MILDKLKAVYPGEINEKIKRKILSKIYPAGYVSNGVIPENLCFNLFTKKENKVFRNKRFKNDSFVLLGKEFSIDENINWSLKEKHDYKIWVNETFEGYEDVKYVWELNRLQFITQMSLDYVLDPETEKIEKIKKIIDSWIENNKVDYGINWCSNLEVSIRAVSLIFIKIILSDYISEDYLLNSLYFHGEHIFKDIKYSEKCIPNNHVIGEASALYILSHVLKFDDNYKWRDKAKRILKKYLKHFNDDGTHVEASLGYQRFVLQMYLSVYLFSQKYNDEFISKELEDIFEKSYLFLKTIEKPDESYPRFGDWDDGVFYKLDFEEITNMKSFVDTLGYFFNYEDNRENITIQALVLEYVFGEIKIVSKYDEYAFKPGISLFENGKYGIIKNDDFYVFMNNQKQIFHSHSDGLSLEISKGNKNITLDSGTYSYNKDIKIRKYMRSTKAHNTVYMCMDQAKQIGTFRWINAPDNDLVKLKEDGIEKIRGIINYKNGYYHGRTIFIKDESLYIKDKTKSDAEKTEIIYHFSPEVKISIEDKKVVIDNKIYIFLKTNSEYDIELLNGTYSPSYGIETKRRTVKYIIRDKESEAITVITSDKKLFIR